MHDGPVGFEVPLYQALLKPQLMLGSPRNFSIPVVILTAMALIWKIWSVAPFAVILLVFAAWGTRQDDVWFAIMLRAVKFKKYYEA